jgi:hypothetical protein
MRWMCFQVHTRHPFMRPDAHLQIPDLLAFLDILWYPNILECMQDDQNVYMAEHHLVPDQPSTKKKISCLVIGKTKQQLNCVDCPAHRRTRHRKKRKYDTRAFAKAKEIDPAANFV